MRNWGTAGAELSGGLAPSRFCGILTYLFEFIDRFIIFARKKNPEPPAKKPVEIAKFFPILDTAFLLYKSP